MIKILFLAGSTRKDSCNKKLAHAAAKMAEKQGVDAEFIDLADYEMPFYDGDYEEAQGLPANAIKLKKKFQAADGLFITSPEYNSSYSAVLKNTIDWLSRPHEKDEPSLSAFAGKIVAVSAASPGGLGGMRVLVTLRMLMGNIATHVIPEQAAISGAYGVFDNAGDITDDAKRAMVENVVTSLVVATKKIKG